MLVLVVIESTNCALYLVIWVTLNCCDEPFSVSDKEPVFPLKLHRFYHLHAAFRTHLHLFKLKIVCVFNAP